MLHIYGDAIIIVEGFQNLNLCVVLVALKHDWILIVTRDHACCDRGPRFL